jgi:hypothetical protein
MGLPSKRGQVLPAQGHAAPAPGHARGTAQQCGGALPQHAMHAHARPPALSRWDEGGAAAGAGARARGVPGPSAWYEGSDGQYAERSVGVMGPGSTGLGSSASSGSLSCGVSSDEEERKRGPCSNKRLRPQDSSSGSCSPSSHHQHEEAHSASSYSPSSRGAQVRAVGRRTASSSSAGSVASASSGGMSTSGMSGATAPSPHDFACASAGASGSGRLPFVDAADTAFAPSNAEGITTKEAAWFLSSLEEFHMSELSEGERLALMASGLRFKAKHRNAILFPDDVDFLLRWRGPTNLEERAIESAALAEAEGSASAQPTDRRILIIHTALRDVLEGYRRSRSNAAEKSCIFSALILRVALHLKRCGIRDVVLQETVEGVAHKEATLFVQNYHISRSNFAKIVKEILKRNGEDE